MRRAVLAAVIVIWIGLILGCTGAARHLFDVPGEFSLLKTDYRDHALFHRNGGFLGGHVVGIAFDERFILIERDVCVQPTERRRPEPRLTGLIEVWIGE